MLKNLLFLFFVTFCYSVVYTQNNNAAIHKDCLNPQTVILPLGNTLNHINEETIHYGEDDKYTYWYKIIATQTDTLFYSLESINEEDEYNALLFKYQGNQFCNDVVYKNTSPLSNENKYKIVLKKGDIYYLGVLHLSGKGCGHYLKLACGNEINEIKAVQNKCIEEAAERYVYIPKKQQKSIQKLPSEPIKTNLKPRPLIKSTVLKFINASTQQPLSLSFKLTNITKNETYQLITENGFYTVSDTGIYLINIEKLGYDNVRQSVNLSLQEDTLTVLLTPIKKGEKLVMYSIYFYPNTYALKPESKPELQRLAVFMKENPALRFEIQGHTNGNNRISKSKKYANLGEAWQFSGSAKKLSKLRAETIKTFLIKQGINPGQLETNGYGGDQPIVKNPKTIQQALKNIRVEVHVLQE